MGGTLAPDKLPLQIRPRGDAGHIVSVAGAFAGGPGSVTPTAVLCLDDLCCPDYRCLNDL